MGKNLHEKNIADAMNKYFQISQRTVNSASIAIPSVIPAIQRSLEMTERISKVIAPTIQSANLYSKVLPIPLERLNSILIGLPNTARFISLIRDEGSLDYPDELVNAVVLEAEEYFQGLPNIDDYEEDCETQEAENLIDKVFNDIQNITPFDVIENYIQKIPESIRKRAQKILITVFMVSIYSSCTGETIYNPMDIAVATILRIIAILSN